MHAQTLPVFRNISFNPQEIETYIRMEPLHPMVFDRFCEDGWCYWADLMFRRNFWEWRGQPCRVVLLRINLKEFTFSKSQRKNIRRNSDLRLLHRPLQISRQHEQLFEKHARRFEHNRPSSIYGFFSPWSHIMPCYGMEFDVFKGNKLLASSFFHLGQRSMAGNYCIHHPEESARSLGTYTMLLELQYAKQLGKDYYYPGFVYDLPSEFDYKLSFNALEYFDWWGNWYPLERLPLRDWRMFI
ncbi:MAG: arginine-tRNA-protein transferase [Saprospiraceae bacterium]|nr:arginine-tRNA-protein transferase [Saprospiraceae bacterium]